MLAIRAGAATDDVRRDTLLAVVRETTQDTGFVTQTSWTNALDAGWSDVELAEAFAHLAANLYTNLFNHYAGTDLDLPPAPEVP